MSIVGMAEPEQMRTSKRRRLWPILAAGGAGLTLVAVSALTLAHDRNTPTDFGFVPTGSTTSSTLSSISGPPVVVVPTRSTAIAPASASSTPDAGRVTFSATPAPESSRAAARRATKSVASPTAAGVPVSLELPTLHVRAQVQPVASHDGSLVVPEDPASVGWWAGSSFPGSAAGTIVIDGHIDSATLGTGALWHLSSLTAGDRIVVTTTSSRLAYRVMARRVFSKSTGIPANVFTRTGPPLLVLISCGGPFDAARGSYEDNIAVFAAPVE